MGKLKELSSRTKALLVVLIFAVSAMIYEWYHPKTALLTKQPIQLAPTKAVESVPKVEVPVKFVKVYNKAAVVKKVTLPQEVKDDSQKEVTAVVDLPPSKGGTEVVSVLDKTSGETRIFAMEKSLSLFAFENDKRIGVGYGIGTNGQEGKVFAEWKFLRVGSVHVSTTGEISASQNKNPAAKAFVLATYEF